MTGESFYEYIANIFYPWLVANNIQLPIILYVDGHSSHLTMSLSNFCNSHGIHLIALYPNATHILQPLDVAFFHPLKNAWRKILSEWRLKSGGKRIRKEDFATLLEEAFNTLNIEEIMKNGFRTTGLYPFSPDALKYEKLLKHSNFTSESCVSTAKGTMSAKTEVLESLERYIDPSILAKFKKIGYLGEWNENLEDKSLFTVWSKLQQGTYL